MFVTKIQNFCESFCKTFLQNIFAKHFLWDRKPKMWAIGAEPQRIFGPDNCWARPYPLWWLIFLDTDSGRHGKFRHISVCRHIADLSYYQTTLEGKIQRRVLGTWCASNLFIWSRCIQVIRCRLIILIQLMPITLMISAHITCSNVLVKGIHYSAWIMQGCYVLLYHPEQCNIYTVISCRF
jgi:hypothetical protein